MEFYFNNLQDGHVQCKKEICPSTGGSGNCYVVLQQNKSAAASKCCQQCKGK